MRKQIKLFEDMNARNAELFVRTCSKYLSEIMLEVRSIRVSAKSVMGVLSLLLKQGAEITIFASGEDEERAVNEIVEKFGEK